MASLILYLILTTGLMLIFLAYINNRAKMAYNFRHSIINMYIREVARTQKLRSYHLIIICKYLPSTRTLTFSTKPLEIKHWFTEDQLHDILNNRITPLERHQIESQIN